MDRSTHGYLTLNQNRPEQIDIHTDLSMFLKILNLSDVSGIQNEENDEDELGEDKVLSRHDKIWVEKFNFLSFINAKK